MKKKIYSMILTIMLIIIFSTSVFASNISSERAVLELVENNICKIDITDKASLEKKLIEFNDKDKSVTIGLTVRNDAIAPLDKPSEIVLVIDNSDSMTNTISTGGTRMEAVADSSRLLVNELLSLDTVKLSIVSFSSVNDANVGAKGQDPNYRDEGTLADAQLQVALTNSRSDIDEAIEAIEAGSMRSKNKY